MVVLVQFHVHVYLKQVLVAVDDTQLVEEVLLLGLAVLAAVARVA